MIGTLMLALVVAVIAALGFAAGAVATSPCEDLTQEVERLTTERDDALRLLEEIQTAVLDDSKTTP